MSIDIGLKIGRITIIRYVGIVKRLGRWECVCECGTVSTRSSGDLGRAIKNNTDIACRKCCQRKNKSKDLGESSYAMLYNNYRGGAKRRSIDFSLSIEEFRRICSLDCHYCGAAPGKHNRYFTKQGKLVGKISQFTADRAWILYNGIDRKDNNLGYIAENCLPCCGACNYMKGTLDYHDFIARCGAIHMKSKNNADNL